MTECSYPVTCNKTDLIRKVLIASEDLKKKIALNRKIDNNPIILPERVQILLGNLTLYLP